MWSNSARIFGRKGKHVEETTAEVMIRLSGLQWRVRTRALTRHFSREDQGHQTAKHHFRKAPHHNFEGAAEGKGRGPW